MDELKVLQQVYSQYLQKLHAEKYLDEQFDQLQSLNDESNPDFVVEVVSLFFEDSDKLIQNLARALEQPVVDFKQVANHAHQFKGSSSSIGAFRLKTLCAEFRGFCDECNRDACLNCLQQLQQDASNLQKKFEYLFQLEKGIINKGGKIPTRL